MRHPRSILLTAAAAVLVAACGSSSATPTPTPAGGGGGGGGGGNPTATTGGGGGGGTATQAAGGGTATQAPGGGGSKPAGWDKYGKVSWTISGPLSANGELGFSPPGSVFGGSQVSLSFFDEASNAVLALRYDGTNIFAQYGDGKIVFVSDTCKTSNLSMQTTSGSGSFDCTGTAINEAGATLQNAKMTGNFTAKAS